MAVKYLLVAKFSEFRLFFSPIDSVGADVASIKCLPFPLLSSSLFTAEPFALTKFPPAVASKRVSQSDASHHPTRFATLLGLNILRVF